jgi:hypothetical protein
VNDATANHQGDEQAVRPADRQIKQHYFSLSLRLFISLPRIIRLGALLALAPAIAGCGDQAAAPPVVPSPTIAAPAQLSPTPRALAPTSARPASAPSPTAPPVRSAPTATPPPAEAFVYLWPAYLPAGMQISPRESRVAKEGEVGQSAAGFFIVTFTSGDGKLVFGGGATDTLPLTGEQRRITAGGRPATLTTGAAGRQVVFDVPKGSLFVYSSTLGEEQLLQIAGSLQPIELAELRKRLGAE